MGLNVSLHATSVERHRGGLSFDPCGEGSRWKPLQSSRRTLIGISHKSGTFSRLPYLVPVLKNFSRIDGHGITCKKPKMVEDHCRTFFTNLTSVTVLLRHLCPSLLVDIDQPPVLPLSLPFSHWEIRHPTPSSVDVE